MKLPITLQRHPVSRLQIPWNYAQLGLLVFPLIPLLGALGIFLGLVGTWWQQYRKIIRRPLNWALAILVVWLVITAAFAKDPLVAGLGLFNFLPFFIFFAVFSALIQTPAQLRQLAWILVLTSVPIVIMGLGQVFLGWVSPAQLQGILGWTLEPNGNPIGRMASVFMYANVLAGYLAIVYILSLGLWIENYQTRRSRGTGERRSWGAEELGSGGAGERRSGGVGESVNINSTPAPLSYEVPSGGFLRSDFALHPCTPAPLRPCLFLTVAVIGNLVALILTNSRNAWAIAICASLAFAVYLGWHWLVAVVAALATSVLGAAFAPSPIQQWLRQVVPAFFWARLTDQLHPDRPVALLRMTQWQFALSMTQQRPWTGWGLRNFTPLYEKQMHLWLGHPHNFLLMLTAETGIPATLFFCACVTWVVVQSIQMLRNWSASQLDRLIFFTYLVAFLACVLFNTVDVTIFDFRLNTLGWLLLSAICGVVYNRRRAIAAKQTIGEAI